MIFKKGGIITRVIRACVPSCPKIYCNISFSKRHLEAMLTRREDDDGSASSSGGDGATLSAGGDYAREGRNGWAVVSADGNRGGGGGRFLSMEGLDLHPFARSGSPMSSLSAPATGGGQTILSSVACSDEEGDGRDLDPADLSIPGSLPSDLPSLVQPDRAAASPSAAATDGDGADPTQHTAPARVCRSFTALSLLSLLGLVGCLDRSRRAWRGTALRLAAELEEVRSGGGGRGDGKDEGGWPGVTSVPGELIVASNCWFRATASASLGSCARDRLERIRNAYGRLGGWDGVGGCVGAHGEGRGEEDPSPQPRGEWLFRAH